MTPVLTVALLKCQASAAVMLHDLERGAPTHSAVRAGQLLNAVLQQTEEALDGKREISEPFTRLLNCAMSMTQHARAEQRSASS